MLQTEARKILKDAPVMWRRINSIGIILDCNSTYANKLGYAKSEILGKSIFEHVPKDSWEVMNDSLSLSNQAKSKVAREKLIEKIEKLENIFEEIYSCMLTTIEILDTLTDYGFRPEKILNKLAISLPASDNFFGDIIRIRTIRILLGGT